jgi:hypothetical protein
LAPQVTEKARFGLANGGSVRSDTIALSARASDAAGGAQLELETVIWSAVSLFPVGRGGARRQSERDRQEERRQERPLQRKRGRGLRQ